MWSVLRIRRRRVPDERGKGVRGYVFMKKPTLYGFYYLC